MHNVAAERLKRTKLGDESFHALLRSFGILGYWGPTATFSSARRFSANMAFSATWKC
jgi:hypothetical protein